MRTYCIISQKEERKNALEVQKSMGVILKKHKEGIMEEVIAKLSLERRIELKHAVVRTLLLESALHTYWNWSVNSDSFFSSSSSS